MSPKHFFLPSRFRLAGSVAVALVVTVGTAASFAHARKGRPAVVDQEAAASTWSPAASMSTPRRTFGSAPLLPDGRVLVAGGVGQTGSVSFASAELYDPATNTWSPAAPMHTARAAQTMTLLQNGKVLAVGGIDSETLLASAELYDPATNTWSSAGSISAPRYTHTATLLGDGKVLVAGGYNGDNLTNVDLYDPATNTWSVAASMGTARRDHTATLLPDGRVLVTGSCCSSASAELYDPVLNTWSPAADMSIPRNGSIASLLASGKVLVGGTYLPSPSATMELYDPDTNTWSPAASSLAARPYDTATTLSDGKILVVGEVKPGGPSSATELYDPTTNTWSSGGNMSSARASQATTLLGNGKVLVMGGMDASDTVLASAELYTSSNLTRTPASLIFAYQVGSPFPTAQSVSVSSTGATLPFTAAVSTTSGGNWLSVSPASATTPATLAVSVNPAGLAAGTYSGAITLTSAAAGNSPQTVAVSLTVSARPNLTRTPSSLTFNYQVGSASPAEQSVSVSSTGATLSFTAAASTTSGGNWLSVSPGSATTPAALAVSVNPAGLAAGTYSGAIMLTSAAAGNSPRTVPVTLTVSESTPATFFPQVAVGGGWSTVFTITNTGGVAAQAGLVLTDRRGNPLTVSGKFSDGINAVGSSFAFTVFAGGTIFFSATPASANDPIKTGWARLQSIGGRLTAAGIFQYVEDGRIETTAGVLQSQPVQFATIPVDDDDSQEKFTAYAIANPSNEGISIKLAVVDQDGAVVVDIATITLGPGQQIARYLHEDLARLKFKGSMVLRGQAGRTFVAVALVQNQRWFTVIPLIPEKAPNIPD